MASGAGTHAFCFGEWFRGMAAGVAVSKDRSGGWGEEEDGEGDGVVAEVDGDRGGEAAGAGVDVGEEGCVGVSAKRGGFGGSGSEGHVCRYGLGRGSGFLHGR